MSHIGRPDDGTDVTSFFNLEFNVPLKPMEQWRRGMTREKIEEELMAKFDELPGHQLQLLAADPRQRRGGALGRQGGQLGQALRHRPEDPGGDRPSRRRDPQDRPRHRERRRVPHRGPAQPRDPDQPRRLRPLRDQRGRRREHRPGGDRRPCVLADGRGGEGLRHRPAAAEGPAERPRRASPRWPSTPPPSTDIPARGSRSRSWPRSPPTSPAPRTSIARTTCATSRSSSASTAATWPRPSPRRSARSRTRRPGRSCRAATASSGRASSPRCSRPTPG